MTSVPFSGAVDLAALAAAKQAAQQRADSGSGAVVLTAANANDVIQASVTKPVFVLLCSVRAPQCADLTARVEALLGEYGDEVIFATVDVEAQPELAQAFQVQAVPAMLALLAGRPAPLFQGAPEDSQLRDVIEQVLTVARQAGMTIPDGAEGTQPSERPLPPLHQQAVDAIERDDFAGAIEAYDQALRENPRDTDAKAGRAQVSLLLRTRDADPAAVRAAAAQHPEDVDAPLAVADVDVLAGAVDDAFARLLDVMVVQIQERDRVRGRLLELFEVVGQADPRVANARQRLASLLY